MPNDSTTETGVKLTARSRVSNGRELFLGDVDGRSREARRFRDIYAGLVTHLGGDAVVTEPRRHLVVQPKRKSPAPAGPFVEKS